MTSLIALLALTPAAQFTPKPPPELVGFDKLIGEWTGDVTLGPGEELRGKTAFRFERILDGLYVQLHVSQDLPGMGIVKGVTTYAWDAKQRILRTYTFANGGMADPASPRKETGTVQNGKLSVASVGHVPPYRQVFEVRADGGLEYRFEMEMGGKMAEVGRGSLKRSGIGK